MILRQLARTAAPLVLSLLVCVAPKMGRAWDRRPQCAPFARTLSNIRIFGNAWRWWTAAAGLYERGAKPEAGSILSFQPDARMPLGHVAVVTRVLGNREIEVDHANWAAGGSISRRVETLDVSANNDWTAVRVQLHERDHFGAVYATNGFIYGWPIELGPQIVDVPRTLQAHRERATLAGSSGSSETLPIVVGPSQATVSNYSSEVLPFMIYGRNIAR
jgi:hypothetical protein